MRDQPETDGKEGKKSIFDCAIRKSRQFDRSKCIFVCKENCATVQKEAEVVKQGSDLNKTMANKFHNRKMIWFWQKMVK